MTSYSPTSEPPLELPLYQATIGQAWTRFWQKYATFSGRASRSEYWWWQLASWLVGTVLQSFVRGFGQNSAPGTIFTVMTAVWGLAIFIPSLAILWRRLHDAGHTGFAALWSLLPIVGWIIVLVYTIQGPRPAGQRFDRAIATEP